LFWLQRLTDELAGCFAAAAVALVVSPFGKVWRVEVGRDGEGAFLGRGWPELLAAHGIGDDWFVVLRHEGGGVVIVKAFDASFCIKQFHALAAGKDLICKYCIGSKFFFFLPSEVPEFWDWTVYINMESNTKKKKIREIPSRTCHFAIMHRQINFIGKVISFPQLVSRIVYDSSNGRYTVSILGACTPIYIYIE
jgi:hypothetical protein